MVGDRRGNVQWPQADHISTVCGKGGALCRTKGEVAFGAQPHGLIEIRDWSEVTRSGNCYSGVINRGI